MSACACQLSGLLSVRRVGEGGVPHMLYLNDIHARHTKSLSLHTCEDSVSCRCIPAKTVSAMHHPKSLWEALVARPAQQVALFIGAG
jgi:hypothetical protein